MSTTTESGYGPLLARMGSFLDSFERKARQVAAVDPSYYLTCAATSMDLLRQLGPQALRAHAADSLAFDELIDGAQIAQRIKADRANNYPVLDALMVQLQGARK